MTTMSLTHGTGNNAENKPDIIQDDHEMSDVLGYQAQKVEDTWRPGEAGFAKAQDLYWYEVNDLNLSEIGFETTKFAKEQWDIGMGADPAYYRSMRNKPIAEPVVLHKKDGIYYVWDGLHRIGGAVAASRTTIPAIIGIPKLTHNIGFVKNSTEIDASMTSHNQAKPEPTTATDRPAPQVDNTKEDAEELRSGSEWKFAMMGSFAGSKARRVYTAADLQTAAKVYRPDIAPKTVRAAVELFVSSGALRRVGHGIYLNRRCLPPADLAEIAHHLRAGAVISLQTVLGECGFLNNPTAIVTAVLPVSTTKTPTLGNLTTQTGDTFRFHGISERFFPKNSEEKWKLLQPGRPCEMFRPEAALLQWLHLAGLGRSTMTPPPVDVDMESLDSQLLVELATKWNMESQLNEWINGAKERDFGEESETKNQNRTFDVSKPKF